MNGLVPTVPTRQTSTFAEDPLGVIVTIALYQLRKRAPRQVACSAVATTSRSSTLKLPQGTGVMPVMVCRSVVFAAAKYMTQLRSFMFW